MNLARWLLYIQIASIFPYNPFLARWCCGFLVVEIAPPRERPSTVDLVNATAGHPRVLGELSGGCPRLQPRAARRKIDVSSAVPWLFRYLGDCNKY